MKTSIPHFKNKNEIWIISALILFSTLAALIIVKNIKLSPDSMLYAMMSQEILSGNGLKVPVIKLFDNYIPVNGRVPYPEEAPLLSILFALLGGVTPDNFLPAQIINTISLVAISFVTFLIMKKLYDNMIVSFITAMLVSTSFPILNVTNHIWTEPLFIAFSSSTIYFLTLARQNPNYRFYRNIFTAGIFASLAFLARFPGLFIIPGFFWVVFLLLKNKEKTSKYLFAVFSSTLPIITAGIIFINNYLITGNIYGWEPPPFKRTFVEAFIGTIKMIFQQFPLGKNSIILIVFFISLFIPLLILNISKSRAEFSKCLMRGLDLVILSVISYTVLIALALSKSQPLFEIRFVFPLVPFLFIITIFGIVFFWKTIESMGFNKLSLYGLILSLVIVCFGNFYKTYLQHNRFFAYKEESLYSILRTSTYKWLKEHYSQNFIITTNRPYPLSFFGGYSTIRLPNRRFLKSDLIPEDMELTLPERMSKFGSRILALFEGAEERYDGKYITKLYNNREGDNNFSLVYESLDGVVYELKNRR